MGFNHRATKSEKYVINCQLSNKTHGKKNVANEKTGEWKFYQDMRTTVSESRILIRLFNSMYPETSQVENLFLKINAQHNALSKATKARFKLENIYYDVSS